jgi:hypothetical protein
MRHRVEARVLGILSRDTIDIILSPGGNDRMPLRVSIEDIPLEFRQPNQEFIAVIEGAFLVGVEPMRPSSLPNKAD